MALKEQISELVTPAVVGAGFYLEDVEILNAGRSRIITCIVDGDIPLNLDQVTVVTKAISALLDEAAFLDGVRRAGEGEGLLHNAFGARALALFERLAPAPSASYLSGLLIGEELRTQSPVSEVVLIGAPVLTERYALALKEAGVATRTLGAEATWAGLTAIVAAWKLLT